MSGSPQAPQPMARRSLEQRKAAAAAQQTNQSAGHLINVIRTLTSSVSEDQRQLEKTRLEQEYKKSADFIDRLVKEHQKDVEECLDSFRDVSTRISTCRERIHNVRNALHTCKTLLECRRDDLKKLWLENSRQKYVCEIMAQLEQLREVKVNVDGLVAQHKYHDAAKLISQSKTMLDGRLATVEGLSQLRITLNETADQLADTVVRQMADFVVVHPFEQHLVEVVRMMPEQQVRESELCSRIAAARPPPASQLPATLKAALAALAELDGGAGALDRVMLLSASQIAHQVATSVKLMRVRASIDQEVKGDATQLAQLVQMVVCQLESSRAAHAVLSECAQEGAGRVMPAFWDAAQEAVQNLVSDHLDMPLAAKEQAETSGRRQLFRFDATAFASSTAHSAAQHALVVCPPTAMNMLAMFPWLRRLMDAIEMSNGGAQCSLRRFVHSFVMDALVERVKTSLAERMEAALRQTEGQQTTRGGGANTAAAVRVLPSCERVRELCGEVQALVVGMDPYADRFAALWLLVLAEYTKTVTDMYAKTTESRTPDGQPARRKISAAWAADEDISRLLMSLPNWQLATAATGDASPATPAVESEREVRVRNERESEILIGNLGTQKKIERAELITEMADVRALASLHESLRWLASEVRSLVAGLPPSVRNTLKGCLVQIKYKDGATSGENCAVLAALEDCVVRMEGVADTCLLLLHLELRVHCFAHLLPLARPRAIAPQDEVDGEVVELGKDMHAFHALLAAILALPKLRYVFDGLGHLCAAIFIHSSQHMPRLSEAGKKRVCRNVWGVQQRLAQITARREAELDRARAFFELLSHPPERLLQIVPEKRSLFTPVELGHLVALSIRSHPTLSSQPGALDHALTQLHSALNPK